MSGRAALAAALLIGAVGAGGCGQEGGENSGGVPSEPSGSGTMAPKVIMREVRFVPEHVVVRRGGTITWTNRDALSHTVTKESGAGPRFDSGTLPQGAGYRRSFRSPGVVRYVCTIHPNQRGTITVR